MDLALFPDLEGVLDVIYNPARTALLQQAELRGIVAMNGLLMLVAQAKEAAECFQGMFIEDAAIDKIYHMLSNQMQNIVLVGMPGCGKSTIGNRLAQQLGRVFIDADERVQELAGKPIPQIFAEDGEECFRGWETQALSDLGKQSGLVIATGGGCVTRERNYPLLHQNSRIIWLQRRLDALPTNGRPLSQANKLSELYKKRVSMYRCFADQIVDNNGPESETINTILSVLEESL